MLNVAPRPDRVRTVAALFAGAAMMSAAMAVTSVVSTIAVADVLGTGWGGLPNTAGIVGTGAGALLLTRVMTARGRRSGLVLGYVAAVAGAVLAVAALAAPAGTGAGTTIGTALVVGCVVAGMVLLGLGNAAAQLSRYAAAELFPPERRGLAIGVVVWSGTVGAVGGPLLLRPAEDAAAGLGQAVAAGPFALAAIVTVVAVVAATTLPAGRRPVREPAVAQPRGTRVRDVLATPAPRTAFAVMSTGQVVMVLVMTAVPLHLHHHGHGIGLVGAVLSAHTLGMFVLSPLTGRILDVVGTRRVMLCGLALLVAGAAVPALTGRASVLAPALFALGIGWNLCFVGGSAVLARDVPEPDRATVEGAVETGVWWLAAVGSMAATVLLAVGGLPVLAAVAIVVAVLPVAAVLSPGTAGESGGDPEARPVPAGTRPCLVGHRLLRATRWGAPPHPTRRP